MVMIDNIPDTLGLLKAVAAAAAEYVVMTKAGAPAWRKNDSSFRLTEALEAAGFGDILKKKMMEF